MRNGATNTDSSLARRISASRLKPSDDVLITVPLPYGRVALQAKPMRATRSSRMCGRLADARPPRRARPLHPHGQAPRLAREETRGARETPPNAGQATPIARQKTRLRNMPGSKSVVNLLLTFEGGTVRAPALTVISDSATNPGRSRSEPLISGVNWARRLSPTRFSLPDLLRRVCGGLIRCCGFCRSLPG